MVFFSDYFLQRIFPQKISIPKERIAIIVPGIRVKTNCKELSTHASTTPEIGTDVQ